MTYYDLLTVHPNADHADLKRAFRAQAIRTHPDHGGSAEAFREVRRAYHVLADPRRRRRYDRRIGLFRTAQNELRLLSGLIAVLFVSVAVESLLLLG